MNDTLIRFKMMKNNNVFEAKLDSRLSFKENFMMLGKITPGSLTNNKVYDPHNKVFLNTNSPISEYNMKNFMLLYLL